MTTTELARTFKARKEGKNFRARCPLHKSRGVSLGLYPKANYTKIVCYAGCETRDVLACVGLHMRDLFYHSRDLDSEALKAHLAKQKAEEQARREQRVKDISVVLGALNCPPVRTKDSFTRDIEAAYQ